jgi:hypothetical protein
MRYFILSFVIGIAVAGAALAQNRPGAGAAAQAGAGNFARGQIVNVNPQSGMMTLRTGTGTVVREQQFRLAENARLFGTDRRVLADGLRFNGLRPGTSVFFRAGTGDTANMIHDLRLFDPSLPAIRGQVQRGTIVNVDAKNSTVVIRTDSGEHRFRVAKETRFFDRNLLALEEGLAATGFIAGSAVWFVPGTQAGTLADVSLANPAPTEQAPPTGSPTAPPEPGVASPIPSKNLAAKIVGVDAEARTITVKTGAGDTAAEQTLKVPSDASFFGPEHEPLQEGLRSDALKPGINVWLRVGTGELASTVRELSLQDPNRKEK